jgi:adenylate kinase family enzyme
MKRIHIIGQGGSGKTSLAAEIGARLGLPHTELDSIFWYPDWQHSPSGKFESQVDKIVAGDTWVLDGNYSRTRSIIWKRVETVIWLDFPLLLCLWRLLWRTSRRILSREMLWGTNRETFRAAFLSKDALFLYVIKTHKSRRETYARLVSSPEFSQIKFVRLKSPAQLSRWLARISSERLPPAG